MRRYFSEGIFSRDLLSSVVVFLVALPLCMGIAIASGMPAAAGLVTGIIGGLVVGVLAGSPLQVSGPAAGLAVLVFELVREHGIQALGPVVLLAGLIQLIGGLCRVGIWFRMTSPAVVTGMLGGIGLLIIASQVHVMIDAKPLAHGWENLAALPGRMLDASDTTGWIAGVLGLATIGLMLLWDKLRPRGLRFLPGALVAVILMTAVAQIFELPVKHTELPENLGSALNILSLNGLLSAFDPQILLAAITFAFIASAETLLSAAAVDRMHQGVRTDYDRELTAQGVGNMLCGVLGALPMTGVIVRSAANVQAGAQTRMSTIFHGLWILSLVVLAPSVLRMTPVACLAGVLVYTGFKMLNPKQVRDLAAYGYGSVAICVATIVMIFATDLLIGVLVGFGLSLFRLSLQAARLRLELRQDQKACRAHLDLVGSATFLNVPKVARTLEQVPPHFDLYLILDRLNHVDHACLELFREWAANAQRRGSQLCVDWHELQNRSEGKPHKPGHEFATATRQ